MKPLSIIIFSPFAIGFLAIVWSLIWHYSPWRKRRIQFIREYEIKYNRTRQLIDECEICKKNYKWILSLLIHLGELPYRNKEKTFVLSIRFWNRFHEMAKIDIIETLKILNLN